ncbi:MAG: hypothetical protein ACYDBJ_09960 [Aggregatilineales bacterium]
MKWRYVRVMEAGPLPAPNIEFMAADDPPRPIGVNSLRALFMNPVYAGVGPYPAIVDDESFVFANATMLRRDGPDQYLVNLLYLLRCSFGFITDLPLPMIAADAGIELAPGTRLKVRLSISKGETFGPFEKALNVMLRLQPVPHKTPPRYRDFVSCPALSMNMPTVQVRPFRKDRSVTPAVLRFGGVNPVIAGVGPFTSCLTDQEWIASAVECLFEAGPEQFVVDMLFSVRHSLANVRLQGMTHDSR